MFESPLPLPPAARTTVRAEEALAVLHTAHGHVDLTLVQAQALGDARQEWWGELYCFDADATTQSRRTIGVLVRTARRLAEDWQDYLSPPIYAEDAPCFSLEAWQALSGAAPGEVLARLALADDESPDEPMLRADDTEARQVLDVVVQAAALDRDVILAAVRDALAAEWPALPERYTLAWEYEPTPAYQAARFTWERQEELCQMATSGGDYTRRKALADDIWVFEVLPARLGLEATRVLAELAADVRRREQRDAAEDARLTRGSGEDGGAAPAHAVPARVETSTPDKPTGGPGGARGVQSTGAVAVAAEPAPEPAPPIIGRASSDDIEGEDDDADDEDFGDLAVYREIGDVAALRERLQTFVPWEAVHPLFSPRAALDWLERCGRAVAALPPE